MTLYVYHTLINTDDSNTVLMVYGNLWDGDVAAGGLGIPIAMYHYMHRLGK